MVEQGKPNGGPETLSRGEELNDALKLLHTRPLRTQHRHLTAGSSELNRNSDSLGKAQMEP